MPVCKPKPTTEPDLNDPATNDWTFREIVDAKADGPTGVSHCERCGRAIRWVHVLSSQDGSRLHVGCCCAIRLCHDYDAAAAERSAKNLAGRRQRFVDPSHWKISRNNPANIWRTVRVPEFGKINLTIFLRNHCYWVFIAAGRNGNRCHDEHFATQREAMACAFELVENLASD